METAVSLYLISQNYHISMREYFHLPTNYFGTNNSSGELNKSENTINSMFKKLTDKPKCCKVLANEIVLSVILDTNH